MTRAQWLADEAKAEAFLRATFEEKVAEDYAKDHPEHVGKFEVIAGAIEGSLGAVIFLDDRKEVRIIETPDRYLVIHHESGELVNDDKDGFSYRDSAAEWAERKGFSVLGDD